MRSNRNHDRQRLEQELGGETYTSLLRPPPDAHHIVAVQDGGRSTLENGITLCWRCHQKRHAAAARPSGR